MGSDAVDMYDAFVAFTNENEATAIEYLQSVVNAGTSLAQVKNKVNNNLLHHAAHTGLFQAVKFCVEHGVNPEQMNDSAQTPVDIANDYKKFRGVFRDIYEYLTSVSTGMAWVGPKEDTGAQQQQQQQHETQSAAAHQARVVVVARGRRGTKKFEVSFTSQWCPCALELEGMEVSGSLELRSANGSIQLVPLAENVCPSSEWSYTADGIPMDEDCGSQPVSPQLGGKRPSDGYEGGGVNKKARTGGPSNMLDSGIQTRGPRQCFSELDGLPAGRLSDSLAHQLLIPGCSQADPIVNDVFRLYNDMFSLGRDILIDSITSSRIGPVDFGYFRTIAVMATSAGLPPGVLGSATVRVHKESMVLEILFFATRQDVKRKGLGRLLNARIKDIALSLGLRTIVVSSKQQRQEFWCKPSIGFTRANAAALEQKVGKVVRFGETVVLQCALSKQGADDSYAAIALRRLNMKPRSSSISHCVHREYPASNGLSNQQRAAASMSAEGTDFALSEGDQVDQQQILDKSLSIAGIKLSDVVWAKYSSYPWWPGQVTDAVEVSRCLKQKSIEKDGFLWTYNFGSADFSQVRAVHVRLFSVGVPTQEPQLLKRHGIKQLYEKAVREAEAADQKTIKGQAPTAARAELMALEDVRQPAKRCGRCKNCLDTSGDKSCMIFTECATANSADEEADDHPISPEQPPQSVELESIGDQSAV